MATDGSNPLDDWSDFEAALFSEQPQQQQQAQSQQQPVQQVQQLGVAELQSKIEAKTRELNALNEKFKDIDTHYVIKQDNGQYVRDTQNMERDRVRREELRDDVMNYRSELQQVQVRTQDYVARFKQLASNYAKGNSSFVRSRLPAGLHESFKKRFNEHLNTYYQQGTFSNPAYQSDSMMQGVVESAFNLAFGEVMRQAEAKRANGERGVEDSSVEKPDEDESWKDDPLASQILARGVGRKPQTLADVMRAERERRNG